MFVRSVPVSSASLYNSAGWATPDSPHPNTPTPATHRETLPVRFGSEANTFTPPKTYRYKSVNSLHQTLKTINAVVLGLMEGALSTLETWYKKLKRFFFPVSIPKLQTDVQTLLDKSSSGFPLPLIRASLIEQGISPANLKYEDLKALHKATSPGGLLEKYVNSEVKAYLASHLVAMETGIKTPDRKLDKELVQSKHAKAGVEDANATIARRVQMHFYGKDKRPIADRLYNLILAIPKVALHDHHSGSAAMAMVRARFIENMHHKAFESNNVIQNYLRSDRRFLPDGKGPAFVPSLSRYLQKYDTLVRVAVDRPETSYLGAYLYTLKLGLENVRYFEYRFNPLSRNAKDPLQFALPIQQGIEDAKAFLKETRGQDIDYGLIFSASRHANYGKTDVVSRVGHAMEVLNCAIQARQRGINVVGYDIQGEEEHYAITDFKPVAEALKEYNRKAWKQFERGETPQDMRLGATIHAGETDFSGRKHLKEPLTGQESIAKSIELFWDPLTPVRIGHGVKLMNDPIKAQKVIEICREKKIGFEQCPKSNVNTGAVDYYHKMPSLYLSRPVGKGGYGLLVSIATDNRTVDKTNLCNELVKLTRHLGARHEDRKRFQMNGIETAFIFDPNAKARIAREMQRQFRTIEANDTFAKVIVDERDPLLFKKMVLGQAP